MTRVNPPGDHWWSVLSSPSWLDSFNFSSFNLIALGGEGSISKFSNGVRVSVRTTGPVKRWVDRYSSSLTRGTYSLYEEVFLDTSDGRDTKEKFREKGLIGDGLSTTDYHPCHPSHTYTPRHSLWEMSESDTLLPWHVPPSLKVIYR